MQVNKLHLLCIPLLVLLLAINGALPKSVSRPVAIDDPFSLGPYKVNKTNFLDVINVFLDVNIEVFAPNATGDFPVFYYIGGFGGVLPSLAYTQFLTRIASHGIIVVAVWKIELPFNSFNVTWFTEAIKFTELQMEVYLHLRGFNRDMHVDYKNSFIAGHSSGAHVPVVQLQNHCMNFRGMVLLSPVDGVDPYGMIPIFVIKPGKKVNFVIPTLQMVTGLDNTNSPTVGSSCAPEKLSGHRFYNAMTGLTWYINATAYGHGDFLDPYFSNTLEKTQFCQTNPSTPKEPYIGFVAGEIVSFIYAVLDPINNCQLFNNLETSGHLGIATENEFATNGWEKCALSQCILTKDD